MSHLTCHGLAAAIGGRTIVSDVDLDVPRGSMLAIVSVTTLARPCLTASNRSPSGTMHNR